MSQQDHVITLFAEAESLGYIKPGWLKNQDTDYIMFTPIGGVYRALPLADAYVYVSGLLTGACNRPKPPNITEATAWDPDRTPIRAGRGAAVRYGLGEVGDPSDTSFSVQFYNDQLHIMGVPYALIIEPEVSNSIRIRMRLP